MTYTCHHYTAEERKRLPKEAQPKPKVIELDEEKNGISDIRFFNHPFYGKVVQMKYQDKWCNWFFRYSYDYREYWGWYEPLGVYICNTSIG